MKKLIAVFLSLTMVLGISIPVFARTNTEIEDYYFETGKYETATLEIQSGESKYSHYKYWYPKDLETSKETWPVIFYVSGTGVNYNNDNDQVELMEHLASWGFIVATSDDKAAGSGESASKGLDRLLALNEDSSSVFYHRVNTSAMGVGGHSQGGSGAINAAGAFDNSKYFKALYTASAPHKELAASWLQNTPYDASKVKVPAFMIAGTGTIDAGNANNSGICPLEIGLRQTAVDIQNDEVYIARRKNADHGQTLSLGTGYMTAWFLYQLCGDTNARSVFTGSDPELFRNPRWNDAERKEDITEDELKDPKEAENEDDEESLWDKLSDLVSNDDDDDDDDDESLWDKLSDLFDNDDDDDDDDDESLWDKLSDLVSNDDDDDDDDDESLWDKLSDLFDNDDDDDDDDDESLWDKIADLFNNDDDDDDDDSNDIFSDLTKTTTTTSTTSSSNNNPLSDLTNTTSSTSTTSSNNNNSLSDLTNTTSSASSNNNNSLSDLTNTTSSDSSLSDLTQTTRSSDDDDDDDDENIFSKILDFLKKLFSKDDEDDISSLTETVIPDVSVTVPSDITSTMTVTVPSDVTNTMTVTTPSAITATVTATAPAAVTATAPAIVTATAPAAVTATAPAAVTATAPAAVTATAPAIVTATAPAIVTATAPAAVTATAPAAVTATAPAAVTATVPATATATQNLTETSPIDLPVDDIPGDGVFSKISKLVKDLFSKDNSDDVDKASDTAEFLAKVVKVVKILLLLS